MNGSIKARLEKIEARLQQAEKQQQPCCFGVMYDDAGRPAYVSIDGEDCEPVPPDFDVTSLRGAKVYLDICLKQVLGQPCKVHGTYGDQGEEASAGGHHETEP
jgi:hypothetical protein